MPHSLSELLASLQGRQQTPSMEQIEEQLPPEGTDVLARTAWGEGRSEGPQGMQAILNVLTNRMRDPGFPPTPEGVAKQPQQFSVWNPDDPNLPKMSQVTEADEQFQLAQDLARRALTKQLPDITGGATHYTGPKAKESWSKAMEKTREMGKHKFFRKPKKKKAKQTEPEVGPTVESLD